MSDAEQQRSSLPPAGGLVALFLALAVWVGYQSPFRTTRPQPEPSSRPTWFAEDLQARLWQDPFRAAREHRHDSGYTEKPCESEPDPSDCVTDSVCADPHSLPCLGAQLQGSSSPVEILGVMVFGGPHGELVEQRLRARYAVVAALSRLGFYAKDPDHLGSVTIPCPDPADRTQRRCLPPVLPFEWFDGQESALLLLWLDDDHFGPEPLHKLGRLLKEIRQSCPKDCLEREVSIIGPAGSGTLSLMIGELSEGQLDSEQLEALSGVSMFSATATISADLLASDPSIREESDLVSLFQQAGITFLRTIATDREIAKELVKKIHPTIAVIVSELDSDYGRLIAEIFRNEFASHDGDRSKCGNRPRFELVRYLRGVDGQLSAGASAPAEASPSKALPRKAGDGETAYAVERPVGRGQFDYLRRLAQRLERMDRQLRSDEAGAGPFQVLVRTLADPECRLDAIGVLGNDVYDKLLVLQALRARLPGRRYFTTDLYADFLHRGEYPWARNLLVGSSFGLELAPELQGEVPPFRDSYQTSRFFSTLLALNQDLAWLREPKELKRWLGKPRLFEIARGRAIDLSSPADPLRHEVGNGRILESLHPRPDIDSSRPLGSIEQWTLAFGLAFLVAFYATYAKMHWAEREIRWMRLAAIGLLLLGGAAIARLARVWVEDGEPISFFDGVSIWPSVFLRFAAAVLALYFLISGWWRLRQRDELLQKRYFENDEESSDEDDSATDHWATYQRRRSLRCQLLRIVPLAALYFVAGRSIINAYGGSWSPARGGSFWVDFATVLLSVGLLLLLVLSTVDATKVSAWLAEAISRDEVRWPKPMLERYAKSLGVPDIAAEKWLDMRFVAELSLVPSQLVFYPFLVILLMIASRMSYFDDWYTPPGLVIVIAVSLAYAIYSSILLRRAAVRVRDRSISVLRQTHLEANDASRPAVERVLEWVRTLREGAFLPLSEQPWLRALLLTFGGGGSLILLDYLALM